MELKKLQCKALTAVKPILDFETFSDWTKLVPVSASVLRAVRIFKSFRESVDHDETVNVSSNSPISYAIKQHVWLDSSTNSMVQGSSQPGIAQCCVQPQDISTAKLYLLRQSQKDSFQPEMLALTSKRPVGKSSRLAQLSPFFSADVSFEQEADSRNRTLIIAKNIPLSYMANILWLNCLYAKYTLPIVIPLYSTQETCSRTSFGICL